MAEELEKQEEIKEKTKLNPKIFIIGIPLFIIQLVVVYIISANLVMSKMNSADDYEQTSENYGEMSEDSTANLNSNTIGQFIYAIEDIIINPAHTNGQRLMMLSVGFDVKTEKCRTELESKEILLKDIIITTVSKKSIRQLSAVGYKDSLRAELAENVSDLFPKVKINRVYFSKYILQ